MIIWDDGPSGIFDRIFGALIAFIFVLLTFVLGPILVLAKFWAKAAIFKILGANFAIRKLIGMPVCMWMVIVVLMAAIYGAYAGTTRTITLLSHIWGTSGDEEIANRFWGLFILGFVVSLFLMI